MSVLDFDDGRGFACRDAGRRISRARRGRRKPAARSAVDSDQSSVRTDLLSMVYSFYEPDEVSRSLGVHMILDHRTRARLGLPHLYLGYWVEGSRKMSYKSRFPPQERLGLKVAGTWWCVKALRSSSSRSGRNPKRKA